MACPFISLFGNDACERKRLPLYVFQLLEESWKSFAYQKTMKQGKFRYNITLSLTMVKLSRTGCGIKQFLPHGGC